MKFMSFRRVAFGITCLLIGGSCADHRQPPAGKTSSGRADSASPGWTYDTLHPTGYRDISAFVDNNINGLTFGDCDTITALFGNRYKLIPDDDADLPRIQVVNTDRSQLLTMFMDNGNTKCDFSEYQVEYYPAHPHFKQRPFTLGVARFISERQITLGMTYRMLRTKIGKPNLTRKMRGLTIYSYQEYNGLYFGDYYFKNDTLVKFRFGTEYP
jgi:hypothetical protein